MKTFVVLVIALLAACAAPVDVVTLKINPGASSAHTWPPLPTVKLGAVTDERNPPLSVIGRYMGNGTASREIQTSSPVGDLIKSSFEAGLLARQGARAQDNVHVLSVQVLQLFADRMVRREANVELRVTLRDAKEVPLFSKEYAATLVEGNFSDPPTSVEDGVRDLCITLESTLQQVTNKALDDPALQVALRR